MQLTQHEARRRITRAMLPPTFSLGRAVFQMYEGGLHAAGPERDIAQQLAEESGVEFDPNRVHVPWSALGLQQRDMTVAGVSGSNYLVGTDQMPAANVLNGASLAQESGAVVVAGLRGNVAVPRISARPSTYWLSDETTAITPSDPSVGVTAATPKSVAVLIQGSRLLRVQATGLVDHVLQREFAAATWLALDTAIVSGSGSSGEPQGLSSMLTPVSGTSLTWSTIVDAHKSVIAAGGRRPSVWAGPAAQALLMKRERFGGSGAVWGDAGVAGVPSYGSPAVSDTSMVIGDFASMMVLIWGHPKLELNPYADTARGLWQARLIVDCDFLIPQSSVFKIITAIT